MTQRSHILLAAMLLSQALGGCGSPAPGGAGAGRRGSRPAGPMRPVDNLIEKHETHFKHL